MNKFELYIFDFDGVIADSEPIFADLEYKFICSVTSNWSKTLQQELVGLDIDDTYNFVKTECDLDITLDEFKKRYSAIYDEVYRKARLIDGVVGVIRYLYNQKFILAIASSTSKKYIQDFLSKNCLNNYFQGIFSSYDLGIQGKPAPDVYELIMDKYKIPARRTVALEDSLNGVRSATSAGVFCIRVGTSNYSVISTKNLSSANIPLNVRSIIKNYDTTRHNSDSKQILDDNSQSLVIYSPTSLKKMGYEVPDSTNWLNVNEIKNNFTKAMRMLSDNKRLKTVVGVGGGTAIDLAKFLSYRSNMPCICIPTMLSTNVFSTDKSSVVINGVKQTVDSKIPDKIIFDPHLLSKSKQFNLYGVSDILSIHTALFDWIHSGEDIDRWVFEQSTLLLDKTASLVEKYSIDDLLDKSEEIYNLIGESGQITNIYGSGRPESGSEHIFAAELEKRIVVPHGISVSLGILIMMFLQNNVSNTIKKAIFKLNTLKDTKRYKIDRILVTEILVRLEPRHDRKTIIDTYNRDPKFIERVVDKIFDMIESEYVDNK